MARNATAPMLDGIDGNELVPLFLLDVTLKSGAEHVWTGIGNLTWSGNTYKGVGSLGGVGDIVENSEVRADGTSVTLSGVDPTLLQDCLQDIRLGAPATIWFGLLDATGAIVADPYPVFRGTVDKPMIPLAPDSIAIALQLENRMSNLQRPSNRRYTMADQRYHYPDDIGLSWVEILNDMALRWG